MDVFHDHRIVRLDVFKHTDNAVLDLIEQRKLTSKSSMDSGVALLSLMATTRSLRPANPRQNGANRQKLFRNTEPISRTIDIFKYLLQQIPLSLVLLSQYPITSLIGFGVASADHLKYDAH